MLLHPKQLADIAHFVCTACERIHDFIPSLINGRPRDELELYVEFSAMSGWQFQLTQPRRMYCPTCFPAALQARDAALNADDSARDTAEAVSGALSEQGKVL